MQAIRISVRALTSVAALLLPVSAHAYWRGGIWVGVAPPLYPLPPPVYAVPPPVYAVPPPVYAVPPPYGYGGGYVAPPQYGYGGPPPAGGVCDAGQWVCPLNAPTPVGNSCACPTNQGPAWGRAR